MESTNARDDDNLSSWGDEDGDNAAESETSHICSAEYSLKAAKESLDKSEVAIAEEDIEASLNEFYAEESSQQGKSHVYRTPLDSAMDVYRRKSDEEIMLIWQTMPRPIAKKLLVLHNIRLATFLARKYYSPRVDFEDLQQIALIELVKSAEVYDAPKRVDGSIVPFAAFACVRIKGRLYHEVSPKSHRKETICNLRTFLLSPKDEDDDTDTTMDFLSRQSVASDWQDNPENQEFLISNLRNIQTLMENDMTETFSPIQQYRVISCVRGLLEGKSECEIATDLHISHDDISGLLRRFRIFLLRKSLSNNPDVKDLDYIFKKSAWMRAAARLRKHLKGDYWSFLFANAQSEQQKEKNANIRIEAIAHVREKEIRRQRDIKRSCRHVNTARFIPFRKYSGPLHPVTSRPAYGHFYTTETYRRYSSLNGLEGVR